MKSEREEVSPAEQAFAEYLEVRESAGSSFDEFCAERPGLEPELRRIYGAWEWADDLLGEEDGDTADLTSLAEGSRYERRREIARGGMGVVYEAFDRTLRRTVAMKVLRPEVSSKRRTVARFLEEAQVTGQLEHPSIVPIYDAGETRDARIFYTMPLVRGRELGELFELARQERQGWSTTRALGVLLRVCEAVGAAHARGVIHRDLKPANVMVGPHEEVYVMDWGLARILGSEVSRSAPADIESVRQDRIHEDTDSSLITLDGQVIGTPSYMSPEQAGGKLEVDRTSDVYSAGAILRLLLVGKRPYAEQDDNPSPQVVLDRLIAGPPPALARLVPRAAPELVAICERAMARSPADRYADMGELAGDLRAFLERRVVSAYRTGATTELAQWLKRNPALAGALLVAIASLVVGLLVSLTLKRQADAQAANADRHFESALAAVDSMLSEVGANDLEDIPGFQSVRRRLLDEARAFYEGFLEERSDDERVRARVARAHLRLSSLQMLLGEYAQAIESQRTGIELLQLTSDPTRDAWVADELIELSEIQIQAQDWSTARGTLDEGLERIDDLLREYPDDRRIRAMRARALSKIGQVLVDQRKREAEPWLAEALEIAEELLADAEPLDSETTRTRLVENAAQTANLYGVLLLRTGRLDESLAYFERSVELREARYREDPGRRSTANLISALGNLGSAIGTSTPGGPELEANSERMVALGRRLCEDYASVPRYTFALIQSLVHLGLARATRGEHALASEPLREALSTWEDAPRSVRSNPLARQVVEALYYANSWNRIELDQPEELLERLVRKPPVDEEGSPADLTIRIQALTFVLDHAMQDTRRPEGDRVALEARCVAELEPLMRNLAELGVERAIIPSSEFHHARHHPQLADLYEPLTMREER